MKTQRSVLSILTLAVVAMLALAAGPAFADLTVLMPYGANVPYPPAVPPVPPPGTPGFKYIVKPIGSSIPGFEAPGFVPDPLEPWADGIAPFGSSGGGVFEGVCAWLWPQVATPWVPNNSDLFVRFHVDICPGTTNVKVGVAIDNDVQLFVNGNLVDTPVCPELWPLIFTGLCQTESCAYPDKLVFEVPDAYLVPGDNVFAMHARDREIVAFLDVQVSADLTNQVCAPPNDPPDCSAAFADPGQLWPPNHKWNSIAIGGVTDPNGDEIVLTVDSIFQDEPTDAVGNGDGNTCPDGAGIGTGVAEVRAERAGIKDGRVYHIGFTATDPSGDSCQGSVGVCVPHDQGQGNVCVDQGALFDSTVCQ